MEMYKYVKCHDTLNPKLWSNFVLKKEVEEKMRQIANFFIDMLKEEDIELDVKDIMFIGSNANYNYTIDSDIDLHIIIKPDENINETVLLRICNYYRNMFNKNYTPTIYGIPVEVYVETQAQNAVNISNGKYSLNYGWIKKPIKKEIEINVKEISSLYEKYKDEFEALKDKISFEDVNYQLENVDNLISAIYNMRQTSLQTEGEFGSGNMAFKELRAKGYIESLKELKVKIINKLLTLK